MPAAVHPPTCSQFAQVNRHAPGTHCMEAALIRKMDYSDIPIGPLDTSVTRSGAMGTQIAPTGTDAHGVRQKNEMCGECARLRASREVRAGRTARRDRLAARAPSWHAATLRRRDAIAPTAQVDIHRSIRGAAVRRRDAAWPLTIRIGAAPASPSVAADLPAQR